MKILPVSLIIFTSALSFFFSANATADARLVCNSCDTEIQALNFASRTLKPTGQFSGRISIGNIQDQKYYAFTVRYESVYDEFGSDPRRELVIRTTYIDSTTKLIFDDFTKNKLYILAKSKVEVGTDSGFESAWDVAQVPAKRDELDQWFHDSYPLQYWVKATLSAYGGVLNGSFEGLEITFTFSDGSELIMVAPKLTDAALKFTFKPNSAEDDSSNSIPDAGGSVGGSYFFDSNESMDNFIDRAAEHGIEIYFSDSSGGGTCGVNLGCNITMQHASN